MSAMGLIHVRVTLRATEKSRKKYQADFLDTGDALTGHLKRESWARYFSTLRLKRG
jgi:hypothetical protein